MILACLLEYNAIRTYLKMIFESLCGGAYIHTLASPAPRWEPCMSAVNIISART